MLLRSKTKHLLTDASSYVQTCILTKTFEYDIDGKKVVLQHPVTYQSGLIRKSQLNLTEIAFLLER